MTNKYSWIAFLGLLIVLDFGGTSLIRYLRDGEIWILNLIATSVGILMIAFGLIKRFRNKKHIKI